MLKFGVARRHGHAAEKQFHCQRHYWEGWRKEAFRDEGCGGCSLIEKSSVDGPARDRGPWPGVVVPCSSFFDGLRMRLSVRIRSHFAVQVATGENVKMR